MDLRQGSTFGAVFTVVIGPSTAIFVPRGVGNAFQPLEDHTAYTYLVNDHWSAAAQEQYTFLNLADSTVAIDWPIPLEQAELSDKDRSHPPLTEVVPMAPSATLVLGASGQLGRDQVAAIIHLRNGDAPYGTYNVTNGGNPGSWAEVAPRVYAHAGRPESDVTEVSFEEYFAGKSVSRRPRTSVLDLSRLEATGFTPGDQWEALDEYLDS